MIYEVRSYMLKPGTVADCEQRFAEAIPYREKYSPLGAFWHTEIGPLNQIIHVWPYENLQQRTEIRAQAMKDPHWPPKILDMVESMESEIFIPAPFMQPLGKRKLGNVYEMRTYMYKPGSMPEVLARWAEAIPHFQTARALHPPLSARLALALAESGRVDDALALARAAERTRPGDGTTYLRPGQALLARGQIGRAHV